MCTVPGIGAVGIVTHTWAQAEEDPAKIPLYLRAKRSWFVIDKAGILRYVKTTEPRDLIPNDEILKVLSELK